jgi:hypothetical protein
LSSKSGPRRSTLARQRTDAASLSCARLCTLAHRGSPHIHGILWTADGPTTPDLYKTEEGREQLARHLEKYGINAWVPPRDDAALPDQPAEHPSLRQAPRVDDAAARAADKRDLMNALQLHTCRHSFKCKPGHCAVGFPRPLSNTTSLRTATKPGSNIVRLHADVRRNSPTCNPCNDLIFQWRANMDVSLISYAPGAVAYSCYYTSKAETSHASISLIQRAVQGLPPSATNRERLTKAAMASLVTRPLSAQEAAFIILRLPMTQQTRSVAYVNNFPREERYTHLNLHGEPGEPTMQELYAHRPASLRKLPLAAFLKWFRRGDGPHAALGRSFDRAESVPAGTEFLIPFPERVYKKGNQNHLSPAKDVAVVKKSRGSTPVLSFLKRVRPALDDEEFCRSMLLLYWPGMEDSWREQFESAVDALPGLLAELSVDGLRALERLILTEEAMAEARAARRPDSSADGAHVPRAPAQHDNEDEEDDVDVADLLLPPPPPSTSAPPTHAVAPGVLSARDLQRAHTWVATQEALLKARRIQQYGDASTATDRDTASDLNLAKLNARQRAAFDIVMDHQNNDRQLLLILTGGPGTGMFF